MRHSVLALPQVFVTTSTKVRDIRRRSRAAAAGKQNRLIRTCTVAGRWSSLISCTSSLQARITTSEQSTVNDCHTDSCHSTVARFRRAVWLLYTAELKLVRLSISLVCCDQPTLAGRNMLNLLSLCDGHDKVCSYRNSRICSVLTHWQCTHCDRLHKLSEGQSEGLGWYNTQNTA